MLYLAWSLGRAALDIRRGIKRQLPTESKPFRVGVVGLGRISRRHIWGYLQSGKAILVAGADPSRRQLKKAQKKYGIGRLYEDFHEMFQIAD